ncbi:hypothetical protein AB0B50_02285 [Streptomyces sp. NPDC041068]|uniref:hypothetical protein n=1 Tax=Streptomyces sp. NPDC041068 TaxID=3155130 RepID=UPI0033E4281C
MEASDPTTFVIAVLGLAFSVVSVCWQVLNYFLDGPRLKVRLRLAVHDDATLGDGEHYSIWSTPARRAGTDISLASGRTSRSSTGGSPSYTHEAFIIRVVNVGRTPVSVFFPNLWFDRRHHWGMDVRPLKFEMNGFYLLNPGESREWTEPLWPGIEEYRTHCPGRRVVVRAVVQLPDGRRRLTPWRNAWKVPEGLTTLLPCTSGD